MARRFTRLTRLRTRSLKPGEKITEHGIAVECLADGDVRYSVNIMVDGIRIHRVIGRESEGVTRTQAEDFIADKRTEAREGRLALPKGRKLALTFRSAAELYMDRLSKTNGKGLVEKEQHFRVHLSPVLGNMPLDRISVFTLETFQRRCLKQGFTVGTFNRIYATYRHLANKLLEWKVVREPLPSISLCHSDNRRDVVLEPEEKSALLDAALNDSNTHIWLFIMIGLHTSLRHSEILSARFDRFDAQRRQLRVRVKGGRWRDQPLTKTIADILEREREMVEVQDRWVFPNPRSQSGHVGSMKKAFRRCVERAELNPERTRRIHCGTRQ